MDNPKYQLVLQFSCESSDDFDAVISLESTLAMELRDLDATVDGHDLGSEVVNISIGTTDPVGAFSRAHEIIETIPRLASHLRAAYKDVSAAEYSTLWPVGLKVFTVT